MIITDAFIEKSEYEGYFYDLQPRLKILSLIVFATNDKADCQMQKKLPIKYPL